MIEDTLQEIEKLFDRQGVTYDEYTRNVFKAHSKIPDLIDHIRRQEEIINGLLMDDRGC